MGVRTRWDMLELTVLDGLLLKGAGEGWSDTTHLLPFLLVQVV